jgi:predicted transcriptional regulator of viral defense system
MVPRQAESVLGREPGQTRIWSIAPHVTTLDGIPITTPARTLLDLATCVDDDELEQALANAIRRGLTTYEEIREVMGRYPRHAGVARLGALLEEATGS